MMSFLRNWFQEKKPEPDVSLEEKIFALEMDKTLLQDNINALQYSLGVAHKDAQSNLNQAIKIISAIVMQHGGEFVLDNNFLEMADETTKLNITNEGKKIRYVVTQEPVQTTDPVFDMEDDDGHCPNCGTRGDEPCFSDKEASH